MFVKSILYLTTRLENQSSYLQKVTFVLFCFVLFFVICYLFCFCFCFWFVCLFVFVLFCFFKILSCFCCLQSLNLIVGSIFFFKNKELSKNWNSTKTSSECHQMCINGKINQGPLFDIRV